VRKHIVLQIDLYSATGTLSGELVDALINFVAIAKRARIA
jgi:hypothetical protein